MNKLSNETLSEYIEKLSSDSGAPGGGSAIGVAGALACSLMLMSLRIAVLKKNSSDAEALQLQDRLIFSRNGFLDLSEKDSEKFKTVMKYWKEKGQGLDM